LTYFWIYLNESIEQVKMSQKIKQMDSRLFEYAKTQVTKKVPTTLDIKQDILHIALVLSDGKPITGNIMNQAISIHCQKQIFFMYDS
jgi:exonuclease I